MKRDQPSLPTTPAARIDIQVEPNGAIILVRPLTDNGVFWLGVNCPIEQWEGFGGALSVNCPHVGPLIAGMRKDGLTVQIGRKGSGTEPGTATSREVF